MQIGRAKVAAFLLFLCWPGGASRLLAKKKAEVPAPEQPQRALHALNRLTFGARPGDLQQVMAMGVDRWIDQQLHPERIDDNALNSRLEPLRTLRMSSKELAENFPDPQEINQVMNGRKSMPSDPARHAIYQVQLTRLEARKEQKQEANAGAQNPNARMSENPAETGAASAKTSEMTASDGASGATGDAAAANDAMAAAEMQAKPTAADEEQARIREEQLYADLEIQQLASLPPDQRYKKILSLPLDQLIGLADSMRGGKGQDFVRGLTPQQKENVLALNNPSGVVDGELAEAKLLRAIYSQRQLEEVMTDFWFNHFNVFVNKGLDRLMVTSYERDVIRPHALGRFEDLLVATAKSPAMLFYLDNWLSVGPDSAQAQGIPARPNGPYRRIPAHPNPGKRPTGLNENYGRELLELHTLSVNGGYSQHDVTEVAKVFTGWTIDKPAVGGDFKYEPRMHEPGAKFVLGHRIKPKGEAEGLEVLHLLATSPQTAHFISLKLAERFVSDNPPPALVDRMAKTFLKKKGDTREVLSVLFHSPEFWDDSAYRAKVKTPFEFVASTIRATGADVEDAMPLIGQLNKMGMPLYGAQPPTGYSMKAEVWVSSSALLNRMNFALALTNGKIRGVKVDTVQLAGSESTDPSAIISTLEGNLVAGGISQQTHDSIVAQVEPGKNPGQQMQRLKPGGTKVPNDAAAQVSTIAGLLLGSPEFQRR